jgi:hypothetical protein
LVTIANPNVVGVGVAVGVVVGLMLEVGVGVPVVIGVVDTAPEDVEEKIDLLPHEEVAIAMMETIGNTTGILRRCAGNAAEAVPDGTIVAPIVRGLGGLNP